jgi:hypothetical protein
MVLKLLWEIAYLTANLLRTAASIYYDENISTTYKQLTSTDLLNPETMSGLLKAEVTSVSCTNNSAKIEDVGGGGTGT